MDYKGKTKESYEKHADYHAERFASFFDPARRPEYSRFVHLVNKGRILDIGAGEGNASAYFQRHGFQTVSMDISEAMARKCSEKGLETCVMDFEHMGFKPKSFDGIWSVTSLLHVPKKNVAPLVDVFADLLKPRGVLYICVKEGEGEGLESDPQGNTSRYFAYWQSYELKEAFSRRFTFFYSTSISHHGRTFVDATFRRTS